MATAEVVAAREHAATCEACQHFLEDMRLVAERIGRDAPRPTAPADVRDRLFEAIARARTTSGGPRRATKPGRTALTAAAALLLVGLGLLGHLVMSRGLDRNDPVGSIVEDRLRSRTGAGLVSSDSLRVSEWLAERLPFAVQVPIFPGAKLTGARLVVENRQAGAVIEYRVQGSELAYYVLPGGGTGTPGEIHIAARDGFRVASWNEAGLTHALVASLPGARLIEFARYCIHQMMASQVTPAAARQGLSRTQQERPWSARPIDLTA